MLKHKLFKIISVFHHKHHIYVCCDISTLLVIDDHSRCVGGGAFETPLM